MRETIWEATVPTRVKECARREALCCSYTRRAHCVANKTETLAELSPVAEEEE